MNILMAVDHAVGISGPHRNVVGSLNALGKRSDVSVSLLTGNFDSDAPFASAPNIRIMTGFAPKDRRRIWQNLRLIRTAAVGCDLIYVPTNLTSFLYAQSVRRGRKLVAGPNVTPLPSPNTRHDSPGWIELRLMSDSWFEPSVMRRDHVRRQSGNTTVQYIHHAIDTNKFSPAHRDKHLIQQKFRTGERLMILYVGRDNEPRKGVVQLLDAINVLNRSEIASRIHWIFAGKMSDQTIRRVAGMKSVTLAGFLKGNDLAQIYASADICVVPSSWENFPFTVLEAMGSGVPVIATRTGGIPEQVIDGKTGVLVDIVRADGSHHSDAAQILADAIANLVSDQDLRNQLGTNARQRAITVFSEDRLGKDLVSLFRKVVDGQI